MSEAPRRRKSLGDLEDVKARLESQVQMQASAGESPRAPKEEADLAMREYFDHLRAGTGTPKEIYDAVVAKLPPEAFSEFRHQLDVYEREQEAASNLSEAVEAAAQAGSVAPEVQRAKIFGSKAERVGVDHAEAVAAAAARAMAQHAAGPHGRRERLRHEPGATDEDQIPRSIKNKRHVTALTDEDLVRREKIRPKAATSESRSDAAGRTRQEIEEKLGAPKEFADTPLWIDTDGSAIIWDSEKSAALTIQPRGLHQFPNGKTYEYFGGKFRELTLAERKKVRGERKRKTEDMRKAGIATTGAEYAKKHGIEEPAAASAVEAPSASSPEAALNPKTDREPRQRERPNENAEFHEALAAFHDAYDPHDKTTTAPAFRGAIAGKSDTVVERLIANIHARHLKNSRLYPSGLSLRNIWKGHAFTERDSGMHADETKRREEQPRGPIHKRFNEKYDDDNLEEAFEYATRGKTKREIRQFIKRLEKEDDIDQEELKRIVEEDPRLSKEHPERSERGKERADAIRAEVAELVRARLEQLKR